MTASVQQRIRGSALWAAYGDALGFITELTGANGVKKRAGVAVIETTVPWSRRVGGRGGPTVTLPAGCISDDTQLRLATSRAIRSDRQFDVEAFSKIELPAWSAYALGGGRGTLAAVAGLRRSSSTWATNFFTAKGIDYVNCGGNGAAMRVQPHAWAASNGGSDDAMLRQVVRNAVCTHGHPRGVLGAAFHAACVKAATESGALPTPAETAKIAESLRVVSSIFHQEPELSEMWLGEWNRSNQLDLDCAIELTVGEIANDIEASSRLTVEDPAAAYRNAVELLGLRNPEQRGSGTKTAVIAALAAWLFRDDPVEGIRVIANELGTDTDSIGTMAGALLGIVAGEKLPGQVMDREYILFEADRMAAIAAGDRVPSFRYPGLLDWSPPKSAADCVGEGDDGKLHLAGLGPGRATEEETGHSGNSGFVWRWMDLWFGQRILTKQRAHPKALRSSNQVHPVSEYLHPTLLDSPAIAEISALDTRNVEAMHLGEKTLHDLTDEVIAAEFDPVVVGRALLALSDRQEGVEASIAFASIIAKARLTRRDRSRRAVDR